ncbi:MAG TPA: O-methyltransferase, partial [Flavitalea sp.]|nr:O-methyltransferase [Flavitalea sp.]
MEILTDAVLDYSGRFTTPTDEILTSVYQQTIDTHPHAHMISGPVQGMFLQFISRLIKPSAILEIGTFTGYSAICLAAGLSDDGELHTIELREEDGKVAQSNFDRTNERDKIILHIGNALDIIPTLDKTWDLVFIDADKPGYCDYYTMVLPKVRPGGFILADNVLFHGQVLEQPVTGKNAVAIQQFNEL